MTGEVQKSNFWTGMGLCVAYILISAGLIDFNKYLMHADRFPYAMTLTAFHMFSSTVLCGLLYLVKPSLYPSMERTTGQRWQLIKYFIPLGAFFAIGLFASNQAYLYCSVAFLQFMKEANIVIVFALSCGVGMQILDRMKLAVIFWILAGSAMAVQGEVRFVWIGFAIQAISQVGECSKNVLGEWLLSGGNFKLDPLTYTMFMAPVCLMVLIVGNIVVWDAQIIPTAIAWWPYLLVNSCLAFCLNVTVAMLIKECSAVGFILAGLVKDIFIVSASSAAFGDSITLQQTIGFTITLAGIFSWSYMKIAPQSPIVVNFGALLGIQRADAKGEKMPLMAEKGTVKP